jgi:hypothetical protein
MALEGVLVSQDDPLLTLHPTENGPAAVELDSVLADFFIELALFQTLEVRSRELPLLGIVDPLRSPKALPLILIPAFLAGACFLSDWMITTFYILPGLTSDAATTWPSEDFRSPSVNLLCLRNSGCLPDLTRVFAFSWSRPGV